MSEASVRIRVNKDLPGGFAAGSVVDVPVGADGQPDSLFWRRRLRDAALDECVSVEPAEGAAEPASVDRREASGTIGTTSKSKS